MGNDGGSIPKRRDLVKDSDRETSTAQEFENKQLNHEDQWQSCTLSGNKLHDPVVADFMGRLYNKDVVISWLLDPSTFSSGQKRIAAHITSIRDVVELHRTYDSDIGTKNKWICPLSLKDVVRESLATKFAYLVPCGHVFSLTALNQVSGEACPECDGSYDQDNVIVINGDKQDQEALKHRILRLDAQNLSHSLQPKQKKKKQKQKRLRDAVSETAAPKKVKTVVPA